MTGRKNNPEGGAAPFGRGPREGRAAGAPYGDPAAPGGASVDPELEADLGAELETRGDVMADELEAAIAEAAEWRDKSLRAQAEFENARKRLEGRHADALLRAGERIVEQLLPVVDDLERAADHALSDGTDLAGGLDGIRRKVLAVLEREGAVVIDPLGEEFDPARHQAVQMQEDTEMADHTVVEVFQKGYEMHGRVLRPAMVVVSTGGPAREE
jgi:molecular chaperone GrpE